MFNTIREFYDDCGLFVTVLTGHLILILIGVTLAFDYALVCGVIQFVKGL